VGWCPDGDFLRLFWVLHLQRAALWPLRLGEEKKEEEDRR